MIINHFKLPDGWTRNSDLEDEATAVFTTDKGTRVVISEDCTPNGFYNVYAKKNFPDGEGKTLATRCKFDTCINKAKTFDM